MPKSEDGCHNKLLLECRADSNRVSHALRPKEGPTVPPGVQARQKQMYHHLLLSWDLDFFAALLFNWMLICPQLQQSFHGLHMRKKKERKFWAGYSCRHLWFIQADVSPFQPWKHKQIGDICARKAWKSITSGGGSKGVDQKTPWMSFQQQEEAFDTYQKKSWIILNPRYTSDTSWHRGAAPRTPPNRIPPWHLPPLQCSPEFLVPL